MQSFPVHTSRNASKLVGVGVTLAWQICMCAAYDSCYMILWSKWGSKYSLVDAPVLVAFIHLIMKVRLAQGHCSALSVCHRAVIKRFTHTTIWNGTD